MIFIRIDGKDIGIDVKDCLVSEGGKNKIMISVKADVDKVLTGHEEQMIEKFILERLRDG